MWELSAPESLVLRDGRRAERKQLIKLGLLELVTRGSLRLVDATGRNVIRRPRVERVLVDGHRPLPSTGPLAPIARAFYGAKIKTFPDGTSGRTIADLARTFASEKRTRGDRYRDETLLPALEAKGLFRREGDRLFGILPRTRWVLMQDGQMRRAELVTMLAEGEETLGNHLLRDPREAAAALATTGAAVLLMTSAYPELEALSQRLRAATSSGDGGTAWMGSTGDDDAPQPSPSDELSFSPSPTESPSPEPSVVEASAVDTGSLDTGSLDLGALDFGDLDIAALDGIDSAFDAIDSGVDSGDGGGDGGGGDGGGGGD